MLFLEPLADSALHVVSQMKDGGVFAAEDADSFPLAASEHKKEGAFCVWAESEISSLLSSPLPSPISSPSHTLADLISYHYGVKSGGNVPSHKVTITSFVTAYTTYKLNIPMFGVNIKP